MSWIDLLLALLVAAFIALGAERRLAGLMLGVGALLLLRPLLLLGNSSPLLAVVLALAAGLLLALAARRLERVRRLATTPWQVAGGLGGGLLGLVLVLAAAVSLPIGFNEVNQIIYPPQNLPGIVAPAVSGSRVFRQGRDILLYPLLDREGEVSDSRRPVLKALHHYLVVGEPWERR